MGVVLTHGDCSAVLLVGWHVGVVLTRGGCSAVLLVGCMTGGGRDVI